jgi:hypothetical protein
MLLSVFTRHSTTCRFSRDGACRRCNCPKWVGGQVNGYYFRQSAKTRQWAEAEEVRVKLEEALIKGLPPFGTAVAADSERNIGIQSVVVMPKGPFRRRHSDVRAVNMGTQCAAPPRSRHNSSSVAMVDPLGITGHCPHSSRCVQGKPSPLGVHLGVFRLVNLASYCN